MRATAKAPARLMPTEWDKDQNKLIGLGYEDLH